MDRHLVASQSHIPELPKFLPSSGLQIEGNHPLPKFPSSDLKQAVLKLQLTHQRHETGVRRSECAPSFSDARRLRPSAQEPQVFATLWGWGQSQCSQVPSPKGSIPKTQGKLWGGRQCLPQVPRILPSRQN